MGIIWNSSLYHCIGQTQNTWRGLQIPSGLETACEEWLRIRTYGVLFYSAAAATQTGKSSRKPSNEWHCSSKGSKQTTCPSHLSISAHKYIQLITFIPLKRTTHFQKDHQLCSNCNRLLWKTSSHLTLVLCLKFFKTPSSVTQVGQCILRLTYDLIHIILYTDQPQH